jgi:hypothetical protein
MSTRRLVHAFGLRGVSPDAKLLAIYLANSYSEMQHNAAFQAALAFDFCQFEDDAQMQDALDELVEKDFLTDGELDGSDIAVEFSYVEDYRGSKDSNAYRKRPICKDLRQKVFERDGHTCRYCGDTEGPFQADHVIPESRGGVATEENLVCACLPCNRSKGAKTPEEWQGKRNG